MIPEHIQEKAKRASRQVMSTKQKDSEVWDFYSPDNNFQKLMIYGSTDPWVIDLIEAVRKDGILDQCRQLFVEEALDLIADGLTKRNFLDDINDQRELNDNYNPGRENNNKISNEHRDLKLWEYRSDKKKLKYYHSGNRPNSPKSSYINRAKDYLHRQDQRFNEKLLLKYGMAFEKMDVYEIVYQELCG